MENENYQSMEANYYESKGNLPITMQRRLDVELTRYHDVDSVVKIRIEDCLAKYIWKGTLEELINQLAGNVKVPEDVNP
jgi:hypothetical protein